MSDSVNKTMEQEQKILERQKAYARFDILLTQRGITPYKIHKDTGIATATLSDWKSGKSMPKQDKMQKIADVLEVTVDFLTGKTDMVVCSVCGFGDNPLSDQSRKEHEEHHRKFLLAQEKFPFLMNYADADKTRDNSIKDFRNNKHSLEDRVRAYERYLEASFSLSIARQNYDITWFDFDSYCKTEVSMLNLDYVIPEELTNELLNKYDVDRSFLTQNEKMLARTSNNEQLMRILSCAEKLSPEALNYIEIQIKALVESEKQG